MVWCPKHTSSSLHGCWSEKRHLHIYMEFKMQLLLHIIFKKNNNNCKIVNICFFLYVDRLIVQTEECQMYVHCFMWLIYTKNDMWWGVKRDQLSFSDFLVSMLEVWWIQGSPFQRLVWILLGSGKTANVKKRQQLYLDCVLQLWLQIP